MISTIHTPKQKTEKRNTKKLKTSLENSYCSINSINTIVLFAIARQLTSSETNNTLQVMYLQYSDPLGPLNFSINES